MGARVIGSGPHGEAVLADARALARALHSYQVILVFLAIVLTSLVLRYVAGGWELRALSRSAWPIRGQALGSFSIYFVEAVSTAVVPALVCLARFVHPVLPVLHHRSPHGRWGGAAPSAQAVPYPAVATLYGMATQAGPPQLHCAATSATPGGTTSPRVTPWTASPASFLIAARR
jgi:hypothetical protein